MERYWMTERGMEQSECGAYVLHTVAQATIAALQADLERQTKILEEIDKIDAERAAFVTNLKAQLAETQARVKELEAIKTPDDAFTYCAYCGEKSPVDEHNEDLAAHIKVCPKHPMRDVESQLTQRTAELEAAKQHLHEGEEAYHKVGELNDHLKAELERVRDQYAELGKMILALPKVEGEILVIEVAIDEWHVYDAIFTTKAGADNYAALLQHRQGMEG